ncbi:hypothetical protein WUBG_04942, partial [Wuchereria bancrofti]
ALFFGVIIFAILIACKLNAHFGKPVDTEDTSDSESNSLLIKRNSHRAMHY